MGASVWVRLRRPIAGVDPLAIDGKLLAKAMDMLDEAARPLQIRPLSDFYSVSKREALAELGLEDLPEESEEPADDHVWWPAGDGLATVDALLRWVGQNPGSLHRPEAVTEDLQGFRRVLEAAAREGVEFNMAISA